MMISDGLGMTITETIGPAGEVFDTLFHYIFQIVIENYSDFNILKIIIWI